MVQKTNPSGGGGKKGPPTWGEVTYPLPAALAQLVESARMAPDPSRNVGLWIDKYLPREKTSWDLTAGIRGMVLSSVCRTYTNTAAAAAAERLSEGKYPGELCREHFYAKTEGRLLVDYGRKNAAETALSFHSVLGAPKICGSAIKGMTRAYLQTIGASPGYIKRLCGSEPEKTPLVRGELIFFDALPKDGKFELSLDVLTPHAGDYYAGEAPPGDYLSPIPFSFLSVVNTTFVIGLALSPAKGHPEGDQQAKQELKDIVEKVKEALSFFGVGAKKAAGYGRLA